MASPTSDWALLLLLAVLLPLHLLSLISHLLRRSNSNNRRFGAIRWILPVVSIPMLVSAIFSLSNVDSSKNDGFIFELEDMKLKLARLESILEENTKTLNSKILHLDENGKLIEEMEQKIQFLQNSLSKTKTSLSRSSYSEEMITAMEEEVRLLWAESRKNNFNIHILETKANEEEKKFEAVTSEFEKMENIVTEQWIQIRQLEQALQTMKIMTSKVHKKSASKFHKKKPTRHTILKFIKGVRHHYLPEVADLPDTFFLGNYISKSCISRAFDHLTRIMSAVKKWHHELQDSVKWALETNEFTAALANKEVVFFLASAIITFPILSAWIFCSSSFGQPD